MIGCCLVSARAEDTECRKRLADRAAHHLALGRMAAHHIRILLPGDMGAAAGVADMVTAADTLAVVVAGIAVVDMVVAGIVVVAAGDTLD